MEAGAFNFVIRRENWESLEKPRPLSESSVIQSRKCMCFGSGVRGHSGGMNSLCRDMEF